MATPADPVKVGWKQKAIGGLIVLAIFLIGSWALTRNHRRRGAGNQTALRAISTSDDPAAREQTIADYFEDPHGEVAYAAAANGVRFELRESLQQMQPVLREVLRAGYLLFNRGVINGKRFDMIRFSTLHDARGGRPADWRYRFGFRGRGDQRDFQRASLAVATFKRKHGYRAPVEEIGRAVGRLEKKIRHTALTKDLRLRLTQGGTWLSPLGLRSSSFTAERQPTGLRLGILDGTDIPLSYAGEGSLIAIAPPGAGKTQCFVIPNMLQWPGPAVVLDVKGEIYASTSKWRAANVGPVLRFSPMDPAGSASYNPLTFVREDPNLLWEDSRFLAEMMIVPSGATDPFWENLARDVVTGAIAHLCYRNPPADRAMPQLLDIVYGVGWDEFTAGLQTNLAVRAMRQLGQSLSELESKTRDGVLKTVQSSLSAWQGERLAKVTTRSDWSPVDLRTRNSTVYICVNPSEIDSCLSVLRVVIAQHIRLLTASLPARDAVPILFVLDEMPRLKKMPPIDEALNIGRQYGIRLWMFAQSFGQLKEAYPNAEGMLGSCAVRIFMNIPLHDELASKISDLLGTHDGVGGVAGRKLVEPVELAGPKYNNLALIVAAGSKPAKVRKNFAWQDAELKARFGGLALPLIAANTGVHR
jgi:type IV secretion system protein VirD4